MKLLISIVISALTLAAQTGTSTIKPNDDVQVLPINSEKVTELRDVDSQLDTALAALAKAQADAETVRRRKAELVSKLSSEFGVFESECKHPPRPHDGSSAFAIYVAPTREYKRLEIRGKYALVTKGKEVCETGWSITGAALGTIISGNGSNAVTYQVTGSDDPDGGKPHTYSGSTDPQRKVKH